MVTIKPDETMRETDEITVLRLRVKYTKRLAGYTDYFVLEAWNKFVTSGDYPDESKYFFWLK